MLCRTLFRDSIKKAHGDLDFLLGFEPSGKPVRALTLKPASYENEITDVKEKELMQQSQTLLSALFEETAVTFIRAKKGHRKPQWKRVWH